jgi:glycine cleavage system transcriptional repressor
MVISANGPDRPGIVAALTEVLARFHANIADSRMVNLGGEFAIIMLIEVPEDRLNALRQALPDAGQAIGLTLTSRLVADAEQRVTEGVPYRIHTYTMDQPGLVHRFTQALSALGVNIEQLDTSLDHAPHTGTPLYSIDMVVTVPQQVPLRDVRQSMEKLCDELNCDLDIEPAGGA